MKFNIQETPEKQFKPIELTFTFDNADEMVNLFNALESTGNYDHIIDEGLKVSQQVNGTAITKFIMANLTNRDDLESTMQGTSCTTSNNVTLTTSEEDAKRFEDLTTTVEDVLKSSPPIPLNDIQENSIEPTSDFMTILFDGDEEMSTILFTIIEFIEEIFEAYAGTVHHLKPDDVLSLIDNLGGKLDITNPENSAKIVFSLRNELGLCTTLEGIINTLINNHFSNEDDVGEMGQAGLTPPEPDMIPNEDVIESVMDILNRTQSTPDQNHVALQLESSMDKVKKNATSSKQEFNRDNNDNI